MKNKIKRLACLCCVFIMSFVLTVTAFAISNDSFPYYVGTYFKQNPEKWGSGHIKVKEDGSFNMVAYKDLDQLCYVSGRNGAGKIGPGVKGFDVVFITVTKCDKNGNPPANPGFINDYKAYGTVSKIANITVIESGKSNDVFIRDLIY